MTPSKSLALSGLLAVLAVPAAGQDAGSDDAKPAAERMICKRQMATGTRFQTRTCRTAKQWNELAELSRRAGKEMIDKASALAEVKQNGP